MFRKNVAQSPDSGLVQHRRPLAYLRSSSCQASAIFYILRFITVSTSTAQGSNCVKKVDHDQRRLEVAIAAATIIAEEGLEALTTRNLARAMGCSIGVLSHYFVNKDEIVIAAMNWADKRIEERFSHLIEQSPMAVDQYEAFIMDTFPLDAQRELEWRVRLNLAAYSLTHPALKQSQDELRRSRQQRLLSMVLTLQQSGNIRSDIKPEIIVQNAIDFVTGTAYNLLMLPMEQRREKLEFVLQYLAALQQQ
jgi:AcrR family transcriptional regulator